MILIGGHSMRRILMFTPFILLVFCQSNPVNTNEINYRTYIVGDWHIDFGGILQYFERIYGQGYTYSRYGINTAYVNERMKFDTQGGFTLDIELTTKDTAIYCNCPGWQWRVPLEMKTLATMAGNFEIAIDSITFDVIRNVGDSLICSDVSSFLQKRPLPLDHDTQPAHQRMKNG